jgi:hypothetical protein
MCACVQEAAVTASELAVRKQQLNKLQEEMVTEFGIASIQCASQGSGGILGVTEVSRQMQALKNIQVCCPRLVTSSASWCNCWEGTP